MAMLQSKCKLSPGVFCSSSGYFLDGSLNDALHWEIIFTNQIINRSMRGIYRQGAGRSGDIFPRYGVSFHLSVNYLSLLNDNYL